jgi:hypothetical protein
LEEYRRGVFGSGFKSLAKRFKIKDGEKPIIHWYRQCDGMVQSLNKKAPLSTIKRYGREECGLRWIKTHEFIEGRNKECIS